MLVTSKTTPEKAPICALVAEAIKAFEVVNKAPVDVWFVGWRFYNIMRLEIEQVMGHEVDEMVVNGTTIAMVEMDPRYMREEESLQ